MNYYETRRDFEFLERIYELEDQGELDADREGLMRNPTKSYASKMYLFGIQLWFNEHSQRIGEMDDNIYKDKVLAIQDRYSIFL